MRGKVKAAHINVRMTPEERTEIIARSSAFGMAPSTFMREAALRAQEKPERVADSETLRQLLTEAKRQGNNLNQAVRAVHTYKGDEWSMAQLETALSLVSDVASQLSNLLSKAGD